MADRRRIPVLPVVAFCGLAFATWSVFSVPTVTPAPPAVAPSKAPYESTLSGTGLVEPAASQPTSIGAPFPGLVLEVFVDVGATVKAGDRLFRLDDRALRAQGGTLSAQVEVLRADVLVREKDVEAKEAVRASAVAGVAAAQARLDRLLAMPRAEELPPLEARVGEARTLVADLEAQLARLESARGKDSGSVPVDDWDRRRLALESARRALSRAEADLALAKAGAWAPDVAEARAALAQAEGVVAQGLASVAQAKADAERARATVRQAEAAVAQNAVEVERATVRAPGPGTVLDVDVRAGEYAAANRDALLVFGDLSTLLVRVDVDEESAPMVRAGARGRAVLRGFPDRPVELEFVRIEPWVRPKKSLTGATSERVDTRVLQVVFRLGASAIPVYVGQQVDVYMEGTPRRDLATAEGGAPAGTPSPMR